MPVNLLGCVVQEFFDMGDHKSAYYQGVVTDDSGGQLEVMWTDGKTESYSEQQVKGMLYNPVAYVYDFQLR